MRWPADHPAVTDDAIAPWRGGADELCGDATVVRVLRNLPGRRVATLVRTGGRLAVLKVFASPRARGNDRRLQALERSAAGHLVPASLGVDSAGHVALIEWVDGDVFDRLPDDRFVAVAPDIGRALAVLHGSGAVLDRCWTLDDEVTQLRRRATESTAAVADDIVARSAWLAGAASVSAHRDCHPRQVVVADDAVHWIDLDDAAMASAGLDVGNFVAHLHRDHVFGDRGASATAAAVSGFLAGYHDAAAPSLAAADDITAWEELALIRLAALAETRHQRPDRTQAILELLRSRAEDGGGRP